jgi:hypothetical protein
MTLNLQLTSNPQQVHQQLLMDES